MSHIKIEKFVRVHFLPTYFSSYCILDYFACPPPCPFLCKPLPRIPHPQVLHFWLLPPLAAVCFPASSPLHPRIRGKPLAPAALLATKLALGSGPCRGSASPLPGSSSGTHRPASSSSSSGEPKQKKTLPRCSPTTSPARGSRGGGGGHTPCPALPPRRLRSPPGPPQEKKKVTRTGTKPLTLALLAPRSN